MNRIPISIIRENDKGNAALVADQAGTTGWVQTRYITDNTVSAQVWAKAQEFAAAQAAKRNARADWNNTFHPVAVVRETEKAIMVEVEVELANLDKTTREGIWMPKSVLNDDGDAPGWMLRKKVDEMLNRLHKYAPIIITDWNGVAA